MKSYGLIPVIVLIVLTNVVVLSGVAYNRSGVPDTTIKLTERELQWRESWDMMDREDSGISLVLKWNMPGYYDYNWTHRKSNWLNEEKLKELGFDTSYPLDDKKAHRYFNHQLPRQGYVVLEFNGDAYRDWLNDAKKRMDEIRQELKGDEKNKNNLESHLWEIEKKIITQSHLFAIDSGQNPRDLRQRYSDKSKYIITPAVFDITLQYTPRKEDEPRSDKTPYLSGWVQSLSIPEIHVTSEFRSFFVSDIKTHTRMYLPREKPLKDLEPRYQATLNYGQRHEPWIADVEKLN